MKIYILIISFLLLISCHNTELELVLINDNFKSLNYNSFFLQNVNSSYNSSSNNVVRFLIKNNSDSNYLINIGLLVNENKFPNYSYALDFSNIQIKNKLKIIKPYPMMPNYPYTLKDKCDVLEDSLRIIRYNNMGYKNKDNWCYLNNNLTKGLIFLKSNEIKYFETFINLPLSRDRQWYHTISKDKKYTINLIIHSDTTNIKKYLTWSQLKNIEENNYKLYQGTITSENSVPIVFVDK